MLSKNQPRLARAGFTLIELLVVIAIIAILAAILFPVFSNARENARAIAATSQAREIGLGNRMYVEDYDETFPIFQAYNTLDYNGNEAPPWTAHHLGVEMEILPYIQSHDIFKDPDDMGSPYLSSGYPGTGVLTDSYYDAYGSSYRYDQAGFTSVVGANGSNQDDQPINTPTATTIVRDATYVDTSNTRIMRDEEFPWFGPTIDIGGQKYGYCPPGPTAHATGSVSFYSQWHPRGGVIIFADGHAKFVVSETVWDNIGVDPSTGGTFNQGYYWGYD
jgi:prepilin-type N-terminal cleavage/methylation domain-containing protein